MQFYPASGVVYLLSNFAVPFFASRLISRYRIRSSISETRLKKTAVRFRYTAKIQCRQRSPFIDIQFPEYHRPDNADGDKHGDIPNQIQQGLLENPIIQQVHKGNQMDPGRKDPGWVKEQGANPAVTAVTMAA